MHGFETGVVKAIIAATLVLFLGTFSVPAMAADVKGPEVCKKCHKAEFAVWEGTKHAKSFDDITGLDKTEEILEKLEQDDMEESEICSQCHFTLVEESAEAGPSCESCHGAAGDWLKVHNDYGEAKKAADESADHKKMRLTKAAEAGMIWPTARYDAAANCFNCHGMARESLEGDDAAALIAAGHPLNPNFELVMYSQGSVRHRFYAPNAGDNAAMTPVEAARWFVTGAAASIVQANAALGKTDDGAYQAAQKARAAKAMAAIGAIKGSVAEAAAFLSDPSEDNARALVDAIADKDLSAAVGGMLPKAAAYK
jgi:hypothetical protein